MLGVMADRRRAPPPDTLAWVAGAVGPGARVTRCRRLVGGITSSVHLLRVVDRRGRAHGLVLKRWPEDPLDETIPMIEREARILGCLDGVHLPVPSLVGVSRPEETDGCPALLMTQVPGRIDLAPREPSRWMGQMAGTLAGIHDLVLAAPSSDPWTPTPEVEMPTWSSHPGLWERADAVLTTVPAPSEVTFIHGDYQHFNLLWSRGRVSGVIDWSIGGRGHPDRDVGHCRLNLAVLFSPEWAADFARAYQAEAGRTIDGWWDVYEISRYGDGHMRRGIPIQVGSHASVDVEGMNGRVERLLADALGQLD